MINKINQENHHNPVKITVQIISIKNLPVIKNTFARREFCPDNKINLLLMFIKVVVRVESVYCLSALTDG
jgi:hypothetical protein